MTTKLQWTPQGFKRKLTHNQLLKLAKLRLNKDKLPIRLINQYKDKLITIDNLNNILDWIEIDFNNDDAQTQWAYDYQNNLTI